MGVIFISIDDNEIEGLKRICNEIFGENNFIANIIWHKMDSPKNSAKYLSVDHDYILLYAKNAEKWRPRLLPRSEEMLARYKNPDNDPRGPWLLSDLAARNFYAQGQYGITTPSGKYIPGPPAGSYWRVSEEKFKELDKDNRVWWGTSGDNRPGLKRFISEVRDGVIPQTYWNWKDVGSTRHSKQELSKILGAAPGEELFITPKPIKLIERMLNIATDKNSNDIVLDFFAGSGTTANAVMYRNANDGGNRTHITVQLPEPVGNGSTIADMTKKRMSCASKIALDQSKSSGHTQELDSGFKVFKLDSSNIKPWDADFENLEQMILGADDSLKEGRSAEDVLYEILLKYGLDLTLPIEEHILAGKTVHNIGNGALMICLDDAITLDVVNAIGDLKKELQPEVMRVVFKDAGFADPVVKTNAIQVLKQFGIDDVKSI